MGCGSSSLKGDDPTAVGGVSEDTRPARKVNTNFATPDYEGDVQKQRRMTEYAPHETEQTKIRTGNDADPGDPTAGSASELKHGDGQNLKPYQTIDDMDQSYPHENIAAGGSTATREVNGDPTSQSAKDAFATTNDPANNASEGLADGSRSGSGEKKRSWIGQKYKEFSDTKEGRPSPGQSKFSDEELKKYTGKDNAEMQKMVAEGKGVGAGQSASMRDSPGAGTGIGFGGGVGSGGAAAS